MLITLFAANTETPDPDLGGSAVTGQTDTGMSDNSVSVSAPPNGTQIKSCRWSAFNKFAAERHPFPYNSTHNFQKMTLKFDWDVSAGGASAVDNGGSSGSADAIFIVAYSTDGGANFTSVVTKSAHVIGSDSQSIVDSGSVSVDIPTTPVKDLSQFAVRARMLAAASATGADTATADVTANVSNLQLEVLKHNHGSMVMM